MNWKGFGTKRSWPNFKVLSRHSRGETEENQENLSQDSRSPGQRIDPGTPEYEVRVLTTRPRRLVSRLLKSILYHLLLKGLATRTIN
jgi:hypothetical protein